MRHCNAKHERVYTQTCRFAEHLDVVMLGVWQLERHKDVLDTTEECGARSIGSSVPGEKSSECYLGDHGSAWVVNV